MRLVFQSGERMMSEPKVEIQTLGGNCPVQAEGQIDGYGFYFRARGSHWSLEIYTGPEGPWEHWEDYGNTPFDAGWMTEEEAEEFIYKAAKLFHDAKG
jgi:hypothetical protein